jgi:radical SAM protein with 4Fe4S-binding SPASM domain
MKEFVIDQSNYLSLENVLNKNKTSFKIGLNVFLNFNQKSFSPTIFREIVTKLLYYEKFFQIRIRDLPYCLISETEDRLVFNEPSNEKVFVKECRDCRYEKRCGGIKKNQLEVYEKYIKTVKDLPREVMIELEPRCNFNCVFCFNKNSFAKCGRETIKPLGDNYVKDIIDSISKSGVKIVRFTGGEPMLRKTLWELMDYAKSRGLKIRLNTNGSLITSKNTVELLNKYVSSILLPIESYDDKKESLLTGYKNSLKKKIEALELLREYGQMTLRAGTVATKENIVDLEKIFNLVINELRLDDWEVYRPVPVTKNSNPIDKLSLQMLVDKLINFQELTGRSFKIVNGVPFCAYNFKKMNRVTNGALSVDGHIRYAIDPRGFAKPDYYIEKNIGNPLNIEECWNHPFMKKMRNLGFVPKECKSCEYVKKCRGGSRFAAKIINNSFFAKDPLMPN